jgi:hypothetical protein
MGNGDQQYEKVPDEIDITDNKRRSLEVPAHQQMTSIPNITTSSSSEPVKVSLTRSLPSFLIFSFRFFPLFIALTEYSIASPKFSCEN